MGYACPVCGDPQVDERHLADHLAFTGIMGDGDHESWLDDHVPEWGSMDAEQLGPLAADHAEAVDLDVPDEMGQPRPANTTVDVDQAALTAADREVLAEARELTRKMAEDSESE